MQTMKVAVFSHAAQLKMFAFSKIQILGRYFKALNDVG